MTYPKPTVAVDLALITVLNGALHCLLIERSDALAVGGAWALPGGFVHEDTSVEDTAKRILQDKANMPDAYLEQLCTYGAVGRDPRQRVISITHFALLPATQLLAAARGKSDVTLAQITTNWQGEDGGAAQAISEHLGPLDLAFDHADILGDVVKRLRGKLDYTAIGLELLPEYFTLRDAQEVHEAILGRSLTKPAFRRKLLDRDLIKPTGRREAASAFRPAELYTRTPLDKE
jgi:8-oxo-dGTP diphosphatase